MVTKPAKPTEASIAIARIETLLAERDCVFVAIDGPCTSGKTTFAAMLNRRFGGNVLHMDDFFLRPEQRTPERFANPAATWTVNGSKRKCWHRSPPDKPRNTGHGIAIQAISPSRTPSNRPS